MPHSTLATLFLGLALVGSAAAQSPPALPVFDPANPPKMDNGPLAPGATAFNEAQARRWLMRAGLSNIMDLALGDDGIWRGRAERQGNIVPVALDRNGDITTTQ